MTQAKSIDLLFHLLESNLVVIPHPEVFLYRVILFRRNVYCMISTTGQALGNDERIPFVCFNPLALWRQYR